MGQNYKQNITIGILFIVSLLFIVKYAMRMGVLPMIVASFIYSCVFFFVFLLKEGQINKILGYKKLLLLGIISVLTMAGILAHFYIPLEDLKIDRWSVIDSFLEAFYSDKHPYTAKSSEGNLPGPMPFYFWFHSIMYCSKVYFLTSLIGLVAFIALLTKAIDSKMKLFVIVFLFTAPFLWYETVTRSNIFANSTLVLWSVILVASHTKRTSWKTIASWALFGLSMSTRGVFIIPAILYTMFHFRRTKERKTFMLYLVFSILIFCMSFIPIIIYFGKNITALTPIGIQSGGLMPAVYSMTAIVITVIISMLVKKEGNLSFYTGITLFGLIAFYFIRLIILYGISESYFNSKADITYFIFCVPFLLHSLLFPPSANNSPHKSQ